MAISSFPIVPTAIQEKAFLHRTLPREFCQTAAERNCSIPLRVTAIAIENSFRGWLFSPSALRRIFSFPRQIPAAIVQQSQHVFFRVVRVLCVRGLHFFWKVAPLFRRLQPALYRANPSRRARPSAILD